MAEKKQIAPEFKYKEEFKSARMLRMYDVPFAVVAKVLHLPSSQLIFQWEKDNNWALERERFKAKYSTQIIEQETRSLAQIKADQTRLYELMQSKALNALEDENLRPQSALEAARLADMGIKGQRELLTFKVAEELVSRLLTALREEVSDQDLLRRIGRRLKTVALGGEGLSSKDQELIGEGSDNTVTSSE
jgi:hypothetical protein